MGFPFDTILLIKSEYFKRLSCFSSLLDIIDVLYTPAVFVLPI